MCWTQLLSIFQDLRPNSDAALRSLSSFLRNDPRGAPATLSRNHIYDRCFLGLTPFLVAVCISSAVIVHRIISMAKFTPKSSCMFPPFCFHTLLPVSTIVVLGGQRSALTIACVLSRSDSSSKAAQSGVTNHCQVCILCSPFPQRFPRDSYTFGNELVFLPYVFPFFFIQLGCAFYPPF